MADFAAVARLLVRTPGMKDRLLRLRMTPKQRALVEEMFALAEAEVAEQQRVFDELMGEDAE